MAKLWLTYAWKDNADEDVDHVIAELNAAGLDVRYDRAELLAGHRLWAQIDAAMNDPSVAGWALFVTENSLKSEPCQEEIAYALDRALRSGRDSFPLIGIFPQHIDRTLVPSALATRLYVNLRDPNWAQQVVDGVVGKKTSSSAFPPKPYGLKWHEVSGKPVLEVWPKSGRWAPFFAVVSAAERPKLEAVMYGTRGCLTTGGMLNVGEASSDDGAFRGEGINHAIDALTSAQIFFKERPSQVIFGQMGGPYFSIPEPLAFSITGGAKRLQFSIKA